MNIFILTIFLLTQINDFTIPYILDSLPASDKKYYSDEMKSPRNDILYIGALTDTININDYDRFTDINYLDFSEAMDSSILKDGLKLFISNRQVLTIDLEDDATPPPPTLIEGNEDFETDSIETAKNYNKWYSRPRTFVQAIPVLIFNPTENTIYLEQQDGRVLMIQEAKDMNGLWRPIEYWRFSMCGNSYGAEGILPNNLALVKVVKYDGDFETEIRLKFKNGDKIIYSDSFRGKINKTQFELPTDVKDKYMERKAYDKFYLERIFLNKSEKKSVVILPTPK